MTQSLSTRILRLGTRGSRLALVQAKIVQTALGDLQDVACEVVVVRTSGDRVQDKSLAEIGGKGLFTKELETALHEDKIDLAVHSMKDVPAVATPGLSIGAVLQREDVRDAFVSHVASSLEELPQHARVGTSSVRRAAQIGRARPDLDIAFLRGNVDTRLAKLDAGIYDAILLAYAGMKRLGIDARATALLAPEKWLPALSQGAIGIQIRNDAAFVARSVRPLNDENTEIALACERAFQAALDGSCRTPIAGLATYAKGLLEFRGEVLSLDGRQCEACQFARTLGSNAITEAAAAGQAAGEELRSRAPNLFAL